MTVRCGRIIVVALCCIVAVGPRRGIAQAGTGVVAGFVRDSLGNGIQGAEVLVGSAAPAHTSSTGAFIVPTVPAGTTQVAVRRLGFRVSVKTLVVAPLDTASVIVVLTSTADRLAAVQVTAARAEVYDSRLSGFNARVGHADGRFITAAQIDRMSNTHMIDALRRLPGVRLANLRGYGRSVTLGGAHCPPTVFIDGFPATAGPFDFDLIDLETVEGIEVYTGSAGIPPELVPPSGKEECGVIAIWSRPFRPRPKAAATDSIDVDKLLAARIVFTAEQVDTAAAYEAGSGNPAYPEAQLHAGVAGRTLVEFVVDTAGAVELGTIRIVTATDRAFSDAVRRALPRAIFRPARLGGRSVQQLVRMPFEFDPRNPPAHPES